MDILTSADLDMQLMQLKHCDGEWSITKMLYKENNFFLVMVYFKYRSALAEDLNIQYTKRKMEGLERIFS